MDYHGLLQLGLLQKTSKLLKISVELLDRLMNRRPRRVDPRCLFSGMTLVDASQSRVEIWLSSKAEQGMCREVRNRYFKDTVIGTGNFNRHNCCRQWSTKKSPDASRHTSNKADRVKISINTANHELKTPPTMGCGLS